ncbi:MAG: aminotransferase class V-fold PLP-dependent enzyme [Planctomycetes bacterium]|nr:aminotransferase class V-fold PLP-dependent enzyme [Planctomycetota bacterium]
MVYFDNAATSHPKPESVYRAVDHFLREIGASPGRSGHRLGLSAGRVVLEARERLARLFNVGDSSRIILTVNCTEALNLAIKGSLRPGDHVVTSSVEHNSVMRPLRRLEAEGTIELTVVPCSSVGWLDPDDLRKHLKANTKLVVVTHASNVVGTIQPVAEIGRLTRERGVLLLVDAAQSAGAVPVDMDALGVDVLAFSGHKGLLGPQGTGGLVVGEGVELVPLKEGGTGSRSQHQTQPTHLPDRYESGTLNGPGIAGLAAGLTYVEDRGVEAIQKRLKELTSLVLDELDQTPGVTIYGPRDAEKQTAVVSFTLAGADAGELAAILDRRFSIMIRSGLHCSPAAHRTIGTFRRTRGTVRVSLGPFNTAEEVHYFGRCLREIQAEPAGRRGE